MNWKRDFKDDLVGKQIVADFNEKVTILLNGLPGREILSTLSPDDQHVLMLSTSVKVLHVTSTSISELLEPELSEPEMMMHRILVASNLWSSRMAGIGPLLEVLTMLGALDSLRQDEPKPLIIPS